METKYEIREIKNTDGKGTAHRFVGLQEQPAMTAEELEEEIESSCSLTRADVRSALTELAHIIGRELSSGKRVHLPEIGYLSIAAELTADDSKKTEKITGKDIVVRGINFKPETRLLNKVRNNVTFIKASQSSKSTEYTKEELWQEMSAWLDEHQYITVTIMQEQYGLSRRMAGNWLSTFIKEGKLRKEGKQNHPIYFLNSHAETQRDKN